MKRQSDLAGNPVMFIGLAIAASLLQLSLVAQLAADFVRGATV